MSIELSLQVIDVAAQLGKQRSPLARHVLPAFRNHRSYDCDVTTIIFPTAVFDGRHPRLPWLFLFGFDTTRLAVLRDAKRVAARNTHNEMIKAYPRGNTLTLYNPYNAMSYAMARKKADNIGGKYGPSRYNDESYLRKELGPGGFYHRLVVPGGAWWRHTEQRIAERDGDKERVAELNAEGEAATAAIL